MSANLVYFGFSIAGVVSGMKLRKLKKLGGRRRRSRRRCDSDLGLINNIAKWYPICVLAVNCSNVLRKGIVKDDDHMVHDLDSTDSGLRCS